MPNSPLIPRCRTLLCATLLLAAAQAPAAVPAVDTTALPVISDNLPVIGATTAYQHQEQEFTNNTEKALPLYYPYNGQEDPRYWDYLVEEQQQARLPVIMLITAGYPWNGNGVIPNAGTFGCNPYFIPHYIAALERAGLADTVKFGCGPFGVQGFYTRYYGIPTSSPVDFANEASWSDVWWDVEIGPWFAAIPPKNYYLFKGGVPLEFWGLSVPNWYTNTQGNVSRFFAFLNAKAQALYGVPISVILARDETTNYDTTLQTCPWVIARNPWFDDSGYGYATYVPYGLDIGVTKGVVIPGLEHENGVSFMDRKNVEGTGVNGDTLKIGLNKAVSLNADFTSIEGWINPNEGTSSYRCSTESVTTQSAHWDYPNHYVNITRSYTDLRTTTLRLQAENCDAYNAPGGVGGVYRRAPSTLDISDHPSGTGWVVSNTQAGGWVEWKGLTFSPGYYRFPICYSSTSARTVQLTVDGSSLGNVTLPATGGLDTYTTAYLGTKNLTPGAHTIRLKFIDGGVNVDWIFVKKADALATLQSVVTGKYLTAGGGGNSTLAFTGTVPGAWEYFTVNNRNTSSPAGTVAHNDMVNLQSYNGLYFGATYGGGAGMVNRARSAGPWENFNIVKVSGSGPIAGGDQVAIKSNTGHYLTVGNNGVLDATSTTLGDAQKFVIQLTQLDALPVTVAALSATAATGSQVDLSWPDTASNESAYRIERSTDGGRTFTPVAQVGANTTTYSDTGLYGSTTYTYRVVSTNATGNADPSQLASTTTLAGPPGIPRDFVASSYPSLTGASTILSWTAVPGATSYAIERSTSANGTFTQIGTTTGTSFTDATAAVDATYYYVATAINSHGTGAETPQTKTTPKAFLQATIGAGTGSASFADGVFTVNGSGGDVWNAADRLHFVYAPMSGDFTIVAYLSALTSTDGWTKSGVMIRQSLAAGSTNAFMSITKGNGSNFQFRTVQDGVSSFSHRVTGVAAPHWVMLVRSGSNITGYFSQDGTTWKQSLPLNLPMSGTVYVGLAQSKASTATFDNVSITSDWLGWPRSVPVGKIVSFQAKANDQWVTVPANSSQPVIASQMAAGIPESFTVIDKSSTHGPRAIALQSQSNGRYLCAENSGNSPLIANRTAVGPWEVFHWSDNGDGTISLRASINGKWVSADNDGSAPLIANQPAIGNAERFVLKIW